MEMKLYLPICRCSVPVLLLLLLLAPARAAAQQPQAGAQSKQAPPPDSAFAMRAAAQKKAIQEGEALPTPRLPDGHVDLNGRWAQVKMYCEKAGKCTLATGKLLTGYEVFKDKNGAVHAERAPARPLTGDENSRAIAYELNGLFDGDARRAANPNKPPYKPELMAKVRDLDLHENQLDPANILCHPAGIPRDGVPARIVHAPGTAVFMYSSENGNYWRIIPTDGRPHRTDIDPSYFGDSVGHWEGDTLVIDVNGFNDDTWFGGDGWFHSTALHVAERLTRKGSILHYEVTVEDPNVLVNTDPDSEIYEQARCENTDVGHFVNHDHF
jgi:hypothetical protein